MSNYCAIQPGIYTSFHHRPESLSWLRHASLIFSKYAQCAEIPENLSEL